MKREGALNYKLASTHTNTYNHTHIKQETFERQSERERGRRGEADGGENENRK